MQRDVRVYHAKAGSPHWFNTTVLWNGMELHHVIEVNCKEGWAIVYRTPYRYNIEGQLETQMLRGRFEAFYTVDE